MTRPGLHSLPIPLAAALILGLAAAASAQAPARSDTVFADVGGLDFRDFDVPAAMVDSAAVVYPMVAIGAGIAGTVGLAVAVTAQGEAAAVRVVTRVHPLLDRAAVRAAWASGYRPVARDDHPVPGIAMVSYVFDRERALSGAFPEPDSTPFPWSGPMVSEVADSVRTDGGGRATYWRRGVAVHGEISVAVLEALLTDVAAHAQWPDEVPDRVWVGAQGRADLPGEYQRYGDIRVDTCMRRRADGICGRGSYYAFFREGEAFVLKSSGSFWAD